MSESSVPIAEHFHSVQGEGLYTGLPMHFIRLAGCTVGRSAASAYGSSYKGPFPLLPDEVEARVCTDFTGEHFWCDTNYSQYERVPVEELIADTSENVICLTGGEPLMHQHLGWFREFVLQNKALLHVETSGTIDPIWDFDWLTISPKQRWLPEAIARANQLKFLVHAETAVEDILKVTKFASRDCLVYLSPIFDPNQLVRENLDRCFELQKAFPRWRLGCQWHKFLGLR